MKGLLVAAAGFMAAAFVAMPAGACELTDRCDFVTGGGWFVVGSQKATFAASGGFIKDTQFWGHLEYDNHLGMVVHGTSVTDYDFISPTTRRIEGTAVINNRIPVTYTVLITDNGEPGRADIFSIALSNGYRASGFLRGGNFEIHPICRG